MLPGYVPYIAAHIPVCKTFSGFLKKMFLKVFKHLLAYEKKSSWAEASGLGSSRRPARGSHVPALVSN
jgi:hypothetical protein